MEEQQTQETTGNGSGKQADEETIESLKTKLAEKDALIESIKSAQKGSDSKNTSLQKEIEELRNSLKERMTEEERKTTEANELKTTLEHVKSELEQMRSENKRKDLDSLKIKVMAEKDINIKYAGFINGNDEKEIIESIDKFKALHDEDVKAVKSKVMDNGDPKKGAQDQGNKTITRADFDKLSPDQKSKKMADGYKLTE